MTGREGERGKDRGMGNERERKRERERGRKLNSYMLHTLAHTW